MLWKLSVGTTSEAEDAVAELLQAICSRPASSYTDARSRKVNVSVHLDHKSDWSDSKRRSLRLGLAEIRRSGLDIGPGSLSLKGIPRQDWAESWKLHFKPVEITRALLLKPTWSRRRPRKGQATVILDPGLSFGTGRHPTTSFCLRQLVARRRREDRNQSCLDIGTGSGILAIAAAKLGYHPVDALDNDPEAIRVAHANARRNGVAAGIQLQCQDLTELPRRTDRKYSVICANLVSNLLLAEQERILARLSPAGTLLVAGILKKEFPRVQKAFERSGVNLTAGRSEGEWRSGAFFRR